MDSNKLQDAIKEAASVIEQADALIIMAGAGMSVDSGLPDYRGNEGLWREYPRLKELGLSFEKAANPALFEDNPQLAWEFYGHRQELYLDNEPHRGYEIIKRWGQVSRSGYFVYTSNVDGHFDFAGFPADRVVECHGNIHVHQCCEPCNDATWLDTLEDWDRRKKGDERPIFYCPECNGVARPNVLMFNDWDWIREPTVEQKKRFENWTMLLQKEDARVVILEIGAGTSLPVVRAQTESLLNKLIGRLIRINLRESEGNGDTVSIPLSALEALERIDAAMPQDFVEECEETHQMLDETPAKKSLRSRIATFLDVDSGRVISTAQENHLHHIKFGKVYANPYKVTLEDDTLIRIEHFEMVLTYLCMIDGLPWEGHIQRQIESVEQYVSKKWGGPITKLIKPKIYDEHSANAILPTDD